MKKFLTDYWISGNKKLSKDQLRQASLRLMNLGPMIPREFQRTTRSLGETSKWKATEFRFFALYAGPAVMKNLMNKEMYNHFLLFHVSCRILCCSKFCIKYSKYARLYLQKFVLLSQHIYGNKSQIMNMHCLTHLVDDVDKTGRALNELSAFDFENFLKDLKGSIKSGYDPLKQACRFYLEELLFEVKPTESPKLFEVEKIREMKNGIVEVKSVKYKNFTLSTEEPNNIVLLQDKEIVKILSMQMLPGSESIELKCEILEKSEVPAYEYPFNSQLLDIFKLKNLSQISTNNKVVPISKIDNKMVCLPIFEFEDEEKEIFVFPLLHAEIEIHNITHDS